MKCPQKCEFKSEARCIIVPRLFSFPFSREKKTLIGAGHVALSIKYD
jgi:hypothetical protein